VDAYRYTVRGYRTAERARNLNQCFFRQPPQEDLRILCRHSHDSSAWHHVAATEVKLSFRLGGSVRLGRHNLTMESQRTPCAFIGSLGGISQTPAERQSWLRKFRAGEDREPYSGDLPMLAELGKTVRWLALQPHAVVPHEELLAERAGFGQLMEALTGRAQPAAPIVLDKQLADQPPLTD
jgi:hypothetical protein